MHRHPLTLNPPDASEISSARDYYRRILPFYERESLSHAHLAFWSGLARAARPRRILEIGAGLGRITTTLARIAPSVGIDVCLEMLALASRRAGGAHFVAADARVASLAGGFDLIVAPGDPTSHMTTLGDRRLVLRAVARQLAPGGVFVLEGLYRRRRHMVLPTRTIRHAAGVLEIDEGWFPVGTEDLWHARYHYRDRRKSGEVRTLDAAFVARAWNPATMRRLFEASGLSVSAVWGDFERTPFRRDASRIVIVARRNLDEPSTARSGALARILRR